MKFASATEEKRDVDAVKRVVAKIRYEIDQIKHGTDFDIILDKISDACELIRQGNFERAAEDYKVIKQLYEKLDPDLKRIVFAISLEIHKGLADLSTKKTG
jgi:hypothetical protein